MPRPRKPSNVLELNGSYKKNPARGRERANEPKVTKPIGPAPKHFGADLKKTWAEIVKQCPDGVLTYADRLIVELAATLLAEWRANPIIFPSARLNHLRGCLAQLGMTPADRSKVGVVDPGKAKGDFDDF